MRPGSDAMPTPKVVVFDLGRVLLEFDYGKFARKIAARGKLSAAEVQKLTDHSPLLFRYETGLIDREQFFHEVKSATGFDGSYAEFAPLFADIFEPIPQMIDLHAALRKQGVPTFIFSNTNDLAIGHIRQAYPFFANFDGYVFSFEHHSMKPEAKLYEVVERMTGRRGPDILYLDDRAENVAAGAARGWQAIVHESSEKTFAALRTAGLPVTS